LLFLLLPLSFLLLILSFVAVIAAVVTATFDTVTAIAVVADVVVTRVGITINSAMSVMCWDYTLVELLIESTPIIQTPGGH
jgi:hypothetical protein